jgi:glucokinase
MLTAGLDVGGTKTLAVLVEGTGIQASVRLVTDRGPAGVQATVRAALTQVCSAAGAPAAELGAVGIGVPGLIDPATGLLRHAVNLGIGDGPLDLAAVVGGLADVPVVVDNDANMAALGAAQHFAIDDLAYLSLGTGVAVGLVMGGRRHPGVHGMAGEIGHLPVDAHGPLCPCGQRGCLETMVSGPAIARLWPVDGEAGPMEALLAAADRGDEQAVAVRDQVCRGIASAVALVAQMVDPQLVVLGGGVADAGPPLLVAVKAALQMRAEQSPLLAAVDLADRVAIVPPDVPVGALGAVHAARRLAVDARP